MGEEQPPLPQLYTLPQFLPPARPPRVYAPLRREMGPVSDPASAFGCGRCAKGVGKNKGDGHASSTNPQHNSTTTTTTSTLRV